MTGPAFIAPMLATLVGAPFDDPDWLFEVKWDGFRVEAVVDGDSVRLWTRGEQDAARYFGPVFDLLHLDGRSLLDEPLEERRALLTGALRPDPRVRLSDHVETDGRAFFEA